MRCLNCHHDGIPPKTEYCPNCRAHLPNLLRDVLPSGTLLDRKYEIDYALGQGSFGITYRAQHVRLEQLVAIKEYYPQEFSAQRHPRELNLSVPQDREKNFQKWLKRFVEEGKILAKLKHPNIVRVQDLFEERGTAYLVMDLLTGSTLQRELNAQPERKLSPQRVREVVEALVSALEIVHQEKIYHLDIKPDNILVTSEGKVILIDFGSAKTEESEILSTRSLTKSYAPPELTSYKPVGPESDIFELGMMLHELLTGRLPESAESRAIADNWQPTGLEEPWRSLVESALPLAKDKRPKSVREWWKIANFGQTVTPALRSHVSTKSSATLQQQPLAPTKFSRSPQPLAPTKPSLAGTTLRGYFILPELTEQGMVRRIGRGAIRNIIPLNDEFIIVCAGGGAALFNMNSGETLWEIDCPVRCGAVSADGTRLGLGANREIYLWDVRSGQFLRQLSGHENSVNSVAFSPDGNLLASGSADKTARLWEVETGNQLQQLSGHENSVNSVAFSPDGNLLASGSDDKTARLWEVETGNQLQQLSGHKYSVNSVAFSPHGKLLASGSRDKTARLWEVKTGNLLRRAIGHKSSVNSVAFSPDGKLLASGSRDKTTCLWEVETGNLLRQLNGHQYAVNSVAFSPDSKLLASASWGNVRLWEVATGKQLQQLNRHESSVNSIAFSPDGKLLASGSRDKIARVWEVKTGNLLMQLNRHQYAVNSVAFSPDGKLLASASWSNVRLWEVATGKQLQQLNGHESSVNSVAFSPDGKLLASGDLEGNVSLWELATGKQLQQLLGHENWVNSLAFSPDSLLIASGSWGNVRLWQVATGKQLRQFSGHKSSVYSVSFSPDGQLLASGSVDKTARLWDMATGNLLRQLSGHEDKVNSVVFSSDRTLLASAGADGMVRLWRV